MVLTIFSYFCIMRNYVQVDIFDVTGKRPTRQGTSYHCDYLLSSVLKVEGFNKPTIFIRDDTITYKHLKKSFHILVADVYIKINKEQQEAFHTDKDTLYCSICARYQGSDDNWQRAFYKYVDDIAIRFTENEKGNLYPATFTGFTIDGNHYFLKGERIDYQNLYYDNKRLGRE